MPELTPLELTALRLLGDKRGKPARDSLDEGNDQAVDCTVRITGTINVQPPTTADLTESPKALTILALVLDTLSPTQRKATLFAVAEACVGYRAGANDPEPPNLAKLHALDLMSSVSRAAKQEKRGAVTGTLTVDLITRANRRRKTTWNKPPRAK